jgi:hypothetical protein
MFILNVGLSHKSKDWLMSLTTEIEKTKREASLEKRCWFSPNWNTIGYWIIPIALELGFRSGLYGWKAKT